MTKKGGTLTAPFFDTRLQENAYLASVQNSQRRTLITFSKEIVAFQEAYNTGISCFLESQESADLCTDLGVRSWDRGGCAALGTALNEFFPGVLYGLGPNPQDYPDHILLETYGIFLDATGAFEQDALLTVWRANSGHAQVDLAPVTAETHLPGKFDQPFLADLCAALEIFLEDAEVLWKRIATN